MSKYCGSSLLAHGHRPASAVVEAGRGIVTLAGNDYNEMRVLVFTESTPQVSSSSPEGPPRRAVRRLRLRPRICHVPGVDRRGGLRDRSRAGIAPGRHRPRAADGAGRLEQKPFDLAKLRGKVVLVSFVYTTCNGVCPLTTQALGRVRKKLETPSSGGNRSSSFRSRSTPERDTAQVLEELCPALEPTRPRWHFLTGAPEEVTKVIDGLGHVGQE